MEITPKGENELIITGVIKTIDDSMLMRDAVQMLYDDGCRSIVLKIENSFALPSAVIGYLMKLVNRDKVKLSMIVGDRRLYNLLEELQLTTSFGVSCTSR